MTKQVIVMRKDLNMRKGKMAAQAAHASLGVFTERMKIYSFETSTGRVGTGTIELKQAELDWLENSFTKICVGCDSAEELISLDFEAHKAGLPHKLITDNGTTEFNGVPTLTCIAIGPAKAEDIDKLTGHLKLL